MPSSGAPRVAEIIGNFRAAGIDAPDRDDVLVDLWQKFVFLTALSATTAGARVDIGTIRDTPELWAMYQRLVAEAAELGA